MKKQISKKPFVFIITLLVFSGINQFANAQSCNNSHPCPSGYHCVNHVCIADLPMCEICRGGCGFICVKRVTCASVQYYVNLNQGWHLCPFARLNSSDVIPDENTISIFPNPVTQSSTILFTLSQSQNVSLKVFDLNGRLVRTLAENIYEAGENEIVWNAENVNAGIYFLQFQSVETLQTEKLIVTK